MYCNLSEVHFTEMTTYENDLKEQTRSTQYSVHLLILLSKNLPLIMVFRKKFLYGGRQKNYFNVKILILVCPNGHLKD